MSTEYKLLGMSGREVDRFSLESKYAEPGYAAGVLLLLRVGWNDAQLADPDLMVGMTVYGSMVQGRARQADFDAKYFLPSDVDATVFYDPACFSAGTVVDMDVVAVERHADGIVRRRARDIVAAPLRAAGVYPATVTEGLQTSEVMAINQTILDDSLRRTELVAAIALRDQSSFPEAPNDVVRLFSHAVGAGQIPRLRNQVIETCEASDIGRFVWEMIVRNLSEFEEARRQANVTMPDLALAKEQLAQFGDLAVSKSLTY